MDAEALWNGVAIPVLSAFWLMIPAYVPNPVAAATGGGTPIDFGAVLPDGRRLFGDGKTYRGFVAGVLAGILVGLVQVALSALPGFALLPLHTPPTVTLMAVGALLGDLGKSFFKRRLGKKRGEKWPVFDQYDLVFGAFVLLLLFEPQWVMEYVTPAVALVILVLTPLLHRIVNIIGYRIRVKEVPW